jgi:hypothetical protein
MHRAAIGAVVFALALSACSGDDDDDGEATRASETTTTVEPTPEDLRPEGPTADLSEQLTGGNGVFIAQPDEFEWGAGYTEEEFVAAGAATAYAPVGELTPDGLWTLEPTETAEYRTRVLVRRPTRAEDFSGTVLVEWLNVSGGADADPALTYLREEIQRQGHAWVGVSAQQLGVDGGDVLVPVDVPEAEGIAGQGLKKVDPERYGSLSHPGDAFMFDIYTQVARALRGGAGLGDLQPQNLIAIGQSQSAAALVTYINGVSPLDEVFDGYFVQSRSASPLNIPAIGDQADFVSSFGAPPTQFRADTEVPVFNLQAEIDVVSIFHSVDARQPEADFLRLWEVAGTAHADARLVGEARAESIDCGVPMINNSPMHVVSKAAFRHLVKWVATGEEPPEAPLLDVANAEMQRNADAIALGGVRTPPVDVPAEVLSGAPGPNPDVICLLAGSTTPLPDARLTTLYPSRADYEERYAAALDAAIEAGYVLEEDRGALEQYAHPELLD